MTSSIYPVHRPEFLTWKWAWSTRLNLIDQDIWCTKQKSVCVNGLCSLRDSRKYWNLGKFNFRCYLLKHTPKQHHHCVYGTEKISTPVSANKYFYVTREKKKGKVTDVLVHEGMNLIRFLPDLGWFQVLGQIQKQQLELWNKSCCIYNISPWHNVLGGRKRSLVCSGLGVPCSPAQVGCLSLDVTWISPSLSFISLQFPH